tara:strand:- start:77 stop:289 length:213 start_codon:yes stop_codon:yes gene_type:complete
LEDDKKSIPKIKSEIKSLKKEIKDIQFKCPHSESIIKFDDEGKSLRKICKNCEQILGYPTEQELKDNGFL